jgi:K+ transporter
MCWRNHALQISFTSIIFPSVALCYMGQAAYLRKFPENVGDTFYKSIPSTVHPNDQQWFKFSTLL